MNNFRPFYLWLLDDYSSIFARVVATRSFFGNSGASELNRHYLEYSDVVLDDI